MSIDLSRSGRVGTLLLNRPEKHNAITPAMAQQLAEHVGTINADPSIRAVIIRGAGDRAFCSGSDLNSLDEYEGVWAFRNRTEYATELRRIRKPVVAALKGWVLGGGLEIALSADVRIAAESARFGAPEVRRGWVGAGGASQLLPRLVGYGRASWLLMSGDHIDGLTAERWGLVEKVTTDAAVWDEATAFAERLAEHSEVALVTMKAAIRLSLSAPLEQGFAFENETMALAFALGNDAAGRKEFRSRHRSPEEKET